jgi:hypothetical protein
MTALQRAAIATPATGLLVYQTDASAGFYYYSGTAWTAINSAASEPAFAMVEMTGDGSQSGVLTAGATTNLLGAEVNLCDANAIATTNGITWNGGTQTLTITSSGVYQIDLTLLLKHILQDAWSSYHRVRIYVNGSVVYSTSFVQNIIYLEGDIFSSHYSYIKSLSAGDAVVVKFQYYGRGEAYKLTAGTTMAIHKF